MSVRSLDVRMSVSGADELLWRVREQARLTMGDKDSTPAATELARAVLELDLRLSRGEHMPAAWT